MSAQVATDPELADVTNRLAPAHRASDGPACGSAACADPTCARWLPRLPALYAVRACVSVFSSWFEAWTTRLDGTALGLRANDPGPVA